MSKFTLTLDASQIQLYQTCPLAWYYSYKENLDLAGISQKVAADKGTLVHDLLDIYYNLRARDPLGNKLSQAQDAIGLFISKDITKELFPDGEIEKGKVVTTTEELEFFICNRFILYVQRWINDDFNVSINNGIPGVELGFSKLLYENSEVRFILDRKSTRLNSSHRL